MRTSPLTLATFIPAALTLVALPFGFVRVEVAEVAAVYGLYLVAPAIVAWVLDRLRPRLPRSAQRVLGALILVVALPLLAVAFALTLLFFGLGIPPAAVVVAVGVRLLDAPGAGPPLTLTKAVVHDA